MWRLAVCALLACKGDAPPSQPPQPSQPTFRIPIMSPTPPALVAVRADDGATTWQTLAIRDDGYDVPLAPRFTLVVVCANWLGSAVEVRQWTAEDNRDFAVGCIGFDGEPLADVISAFAPGDVVQQVATGGIHETCSNGVSGCRLRTGTHDAIVVHGVAFDAMRGRIVRDLEIFDGARFDANASQGWRPDRRMLEIVSADRGNNNSAYLCLVTKRGDQLACSGQTYWGEFPARVEQEYIRVPEAARLASDCDVLEVQRTRMCLADAPRTRVEIAQRSVPAFSYDRATRTLAFTLADADALGVGTRDPAPKSARWRIMATRRWLGRATTYALPALAAIPGWRAEWSVNAESVDGELVWGPKPSSNRPRPSLWQQLRPGDRMDTAPATVDSK